MLVCDAARSEKQGPVLGDSKRRKCARRNKHLNEKVAKF